MTSIIRTIQIGSMISSAAFTGVMICIYCSHLTIWQQASPQEFLQIFQRFSPGISNATGFTGILALTLSLIALLVCWKKQTRIYWLWSLILISGVIALTMIYFVKANNSFISQSIMIEDISATLETWGMLHVIRIILAILASVITGLGISYSNKKSKSNTD